MPWDKCHIQCSTAANNLPQSPRVLAVEAGLVSGSVCIQMDDFQVAEGLDPISQRHEKVMVSFLEAEHPLPFEAVEVAQHRV